MLVYSKLAIMHDYDHMTVDERKELLEKYRMIGLVDEYFSGFWLLVPRS